MLWNAFIDCDFFHTSVVVNRIYISDRRVPLYHVGFTIGKDNIEHFRYRYSEDGMIIKMVLKLWRTNFIPTKFYWRVTMKLKFSCFSHIISLDGMNTILQ